MQLYYFPKKTITMVIINSIIVIGSRVINSILIIIIIVYDINSLVYHIESI